MPRPHSTIPTCRHPHHPPHPALPTLDRRHSPPFPRSYQSTSHAGRRDIPNTATACLRHTHSAQLQL